MKRVIITGATSMIGAALAAQWGQQKAKVYAVVRPGSKKLIRLAGVKGLYLVECEISKLKSLPELIGESCDIFYHLAWSYTGKARDASVELQSHNITYTLAAVRAAKALGCRRFIGAGSQAEYGLKNLDTIGPETPALPITPYGVSKLAAGQLALLLGMQLGVECIWPRIFSVYGIYDKESSMILSGLKKMLHGCPTAFTKGEQRWDYLYSADAGRALLLLGERGQAWQIYCIGSGQGIRLADFINKMSEAVDPQIVPGLGRLSYPKGAVMNLCADITTLREDTGFTPEYSFEQGIRETIEWLRRTTDAKKDISGYPDL